MKQLLITGYSGFVGSVLVDRLKADYHLKFLGRSPSQLAAVYLCNIDATSVYEDALKNVDVVIHCAARVHVMNESETNSLSEFRKVNSNGTMNLANQAAQAGVKRFIFLSSIKVNGESTTWDTPFTEQDIPNPTDPYGISKAEAEEKLFELSSKTNMEVVIIRPPLVYGEGVKANFASLMKFVGKNLPLPLGALNDNKRSLVSVYNLVDLITVCIEHKKAANEVFLVSDDNDLSTAQMISLMAKVQNKKNLSVAVPVWLIVLMGRLLNKNDIIERLTGSLQLDITHTKKTLGWTPPFSVDYGFDLAQKNMLEAHK